MMALLALLVAMMVLMLDTPSKHGHQAGKPDNWLQNVGSNDCAEGIAGK